jgi:threonine aldolase
MVEPVDLATELSVLADYARSQAHAPLSTLTFPEPQARFDPSNPLSMPPVWPAWDRPLPVCSYPTASTEGGGGGGQDVYGQGGLLSHFEAHVANAIGKEAAVWAPTGTMAQLVALRVHSQGRNRIFACHPRCHLLLHENQAFDVLMGFSALQIGSPPSRPLNAAQVEAAFAKHWKQPCCLLIELPDRELGGQCITWEELVAIRELCDRRAIKMHLDGARLFEVAAPFFRRSLQEICSLFDSVYLSMYKGLCGPPGALLLGSKAFITECRAWTHRMGGRPWHNGMAVLAAQKAWNERAACNPVASGAMMREADKMRELVAALTQAQLRFVEENRQKIEACMAVPAPSAAVAAPTAAAAAESSDAAASSAPPAAAVAASAASPAAAAAVVPAQPFFSFTPAVPTCSMVHMTLRCTQAEAEALREAVKNATAQAAAAASAVNSSSTGLTLFSRIRGASSRACAFEWHIGPANAALDAATVVRGWTEFMRLRLEQCAKVHAAAASAASS